MRALHHAQRSLPAMLCRAAIRCCLMLGRRGPRLRAGDRPCCRQVLSDLDLSGWSAHVQPILLWQRDMLVLQQPQPVTGTCSGLVTAGCSLRWVRLYLLVVYIRRNQLLGLECLRADKRSPCGSFRPGCCCGGLQPRLCPGHKRNNGMLGLEQCRPDIHPCIRCLWAGHSDRRRRLYLCAVDHWRCRVLRRQRGWSGVGASSCSCRPGSGQRRQPPCLLSLCSWPHLLLGI